MSLLTTAFFHPSVAVPRSPVRPAARVFPKTPSRPSQRTQLIRELLARLCTDPRTVYLGGKVSPGQSLPRAAWFRFSFAAFDNTVRYQLHFPLPTSTSSTTVTFYIEIAHLWCKLRTWDGGSTPVASLVIDITAMLLELVEADAIEKKALQKVLSTTPRYSTKYDWTKGDPTAMWSRLDREEELHQEAIGEMLGI